MASVLSEVVPASPAIGVETLKVAKEEQPVFEPKPIYELTHMPYDSRRGLAWDEIASSSGYTQYDTAMYPFASVLAKIFDDWASPLSELHRFFEDTAAWERLTLDNDTKTKFHRKYYDSPHYSELRDLYYKFVQSEILSLFAYEPEGYIVQRDPSFRIHLPNNSAIGWRPGRGDPEDQVGLHCDGEYGHPAGEINFMLCFTDQYGSNSCYTESEPGKRDFSPITMPYGSVFHFYGNKCMHFNRVNDTGVTRISIDFRVIPFSKYDASTRIASLHGKRPFTIDDGGYYVLMKAPTAPTTVPASSIAA